MTVETAVITGGASGFGRALAQQCAQRAMNVALLDLDAERAAAEASALADACGVGALGLGVDVSNSDSVAAAATAVSERFGGVDLVVSNVGVQLFGAVERLTDDELRWVLDVNIVGAARTAREFLPSLRQSANARLAFTLSSSVLDPGARMGAYQASKYGLWGLAETIRMEVADDGIAVSLVFPSGMISRHLETSSAAQPDSVRRLIGEPEDFQAMLASNPDLALAVISPEDAAANTIDALLAGERYIITHGDLVGAVHSRGLALTAAAERARQRA